MINVEKGLEYNVSEIRGTGDIDINERYKTIQYPFDKYQISVQLNESNEFIGINEVKLDKDFLSLEQKISIQGFHDVGKFYSE
jgi:hypothetical protein